MSRNVSRRRFLQSTTALGTLGVLATCGVAARPGRAAGFQSAADRPTVALIGAGGRGLSMARSAERFGDVVAVCDSDLAHAEKAQAALAGKPAVFRDYRKLLDARDDVDVVINATPEHWHTAINIACCRSGKDIYAEKPLTLTIEEGQILRRVVAETNRIVQVGTQQRSAAHFRTACELVRNGRIGQLRQVVVLLPLYPTKGGPFAVKPVPKKLDWDMYQGPALERPYYPERTHFSWRFWSEYGGGKICDWGQHHLDIAFWGMDMEQSGPLEIEGRGFWPNHGKPDCYNNADRFVVRMKFPGEIDLLYLVVRDKKYLKTLADGDMTAEEDTELFAGVDEAWRKEQRDGIMFIGERGRVFANRGAAYGRAVEELADRPLGSDAVRLYKSDDQMGNFFECVKSRRQPISTVDVAHRVISACHLGNVAMHLGRKIHWDPEKEEIVGDAEAAASPYVRREPRKGFELPS